VSQPKSDLALSCFAAAVTTVIVWFSIEFAIGFAGFVPADKAPQRYTVHFDGIDYQDLTRDYHGLSRSRAEYKTKAGKRIEFHGSFYEVEQ
jgi:hypothetical protein